MTMRRNWGKNVPMDLPKLADSTTKNMEGLSKVQMAELVYNHTRMTIVTLRRGEIYAKEEKEIEI